MSPQKQAIRKSPMSSDKRKVALVCLLMAALVSLWANSCWQQAEAIATINIWKHRYPFYGGYGGYYPFWGGYGGFGGGYGGIGIGGYGRRR